jgi:hypothetical protein
MAVVEQEKAQEKIDYSKIFILPSYSDVFILPGSLTIVKRHSLSTDREEYVEDTHKCGNCSNFLKTFCKYREIAVSSEYYCNEYDEKDKIRKMLEKVGVF